MRLKRSEHSEQVTLFQWLKLWEIREPRLKFIFAIPNESYGGGKRAMIRGRYFKLEGRKRGVPDICVPIPSEGYHGMFIEMKFGKNKTSKEQRTYLDFLARQGYKTIVCYNMDEAKKAIWDYLNLDL